MDERDENDHDKLLYMLSMTCGLPYPTAMMPARKADGTRFTVGNVTTPLDALAVVPFSGLVGRKMLGVLEKSTCRVEDRGRRK